MEFDKPSTKYLFIATLILVLCIFSTIFYKLHQYDVKDQERSTRRRNACKELGLVYGDEVKVKEGFYKNILFVAVSPGIVFNSNGDFETYKLKYYYGPSSETLQFYCEDLKRNE